MKSEKPRNIKQKKAEIFCLMQGWGPEPAHASLLLSVLYPTTSTPYSQAGRQSLWHVQRGLVENPQNRLLVKHCCLKTCTFL